jgi:hypothetical protein
MGVMASDKKIAAARANGARSRGPVTTEGKRRSSRANVEVALLARTIVLDAESPQRFHALIVSLEDELQPETAIENLLIQKMAVAHWRLMRVWAMERARIAYDAAPPETYATDGTPIGPYIDDPPTRDAIAFAKSNGHMSEYEMRCDRQFTRALDRFEKIRATRSQQVLQSKDSGRKSEPS